MIDKIDLLSIYFQDYAHCFKATPRRITTVETCFMASNFYDYRLIAGFDFNHQKINVWVMSSKDNVLSVDGYIRVCLYDPNGPETFFRKIDQIYNDAYFSSKKNLVRAECAGHRH